MVHLRLHSGTAGEAERRTASCFGWLLVFGTECGFDTGHGHFDRIDLCR